MVPAPVQYRLGFLPEPQRSKVIASYENRPHLNLDGDALSFREYMIAGFGERLAYDFLIPQNEKTQATDLSRLSQRAVRRFFPKPDDRLIAAGMDLMAPQPHEYNSNFWYPKEGGIEHLVKGLGKGLPQIRYCEEVTSINLQRRELTTSSGCQYQWDHLITTIPLRSFLEKVGDIPLLEAARKLTHSTTVVLNIGANGPVAPALRDAHWIYVPSPDCLFYRVGVYSNISSGLCASNYHSLYVEIGVPGEQVGYLNLKAIASQAVDQLSDLGWVKEEHITTAVVNIIRVAYIHHTKER